MRRGKRNMPKFQDYDELIFSVQNTKANYKKKYRVVNPVETGVQVNWIENFLPTNLPRVPPQEQKVQGGEARGMHQHKIFKKTIHESGRHWEGGAYGGWRNEDIRVYIFCDKTFLNFLPELSWSCRNFCDNWQPKFKPHWNHSSWRRLAKRHQQTRRGANCPIPKKTGERRSLFDSNERND